MTSWEREEPFADQDEDRSDDTERKMTVCIAAACQHNGENAIAMVCDWQSTYGDFVKSNDTYKMRHIGRFTAMISGDETDGDRLLSLITPQLRMYEAAAKPREDLDIRASQLLADMKPAIAQHRTENREHFVKMDLGTSFEEFRLHGRTWFSNRQHRKAWKRIRDVGLGCSVIVSYADDEENIIIGISNKGGKPVWESNFLCIGSGSDIALATLCQSPYDADTMPLMECLARIWVAKTVAEKNPYVGDDHAFDVLIRGSTKRVLSDKGWEYLKANGKRALWEKSELVFEEDFLEESRHD